MSGARLLWGGASGGLELRAAEDGGARLSGRFPYRDTAELAPGRREVFASRAFASRVEAGEEVHLLLGHDYNRPLASTRAGSLVLRDGDDGLHFEATVTPDMARSTTGRDALAMISGRLATGVSPGFAVPRGGDEVRSTPDGGLLRTVRQAELHEISIVTRPAYQHAQVEARNWTAARSASLPTFALKRWRA
jgi:HK97 family phage prohead protease